MNNSASTHDITSTHHNRAHRNIVITGANKGIGLELVRHYLNQHHECNHLYACCRTASEALTKLAENTPNQVQIIANINVATDCTQQLVTALSGISIDLLINNAGILRSDILGDIDYDSIRQQFEVNALAPLKITEALVPQLSKTAQVAMITSRMGSVADNTSGGRYGYRMAKAALNIASVSLAHDLASRGIIVSILHPGFVGTDMVGGHGDLTPKQAAEQLAERIAEATLETSGTFLHSNGTPLPW